MPVEARAQTLAHLRLVAGLPGFWELRALQRQGGATMAPRGSFFIIATTTADGALLYDRLEQAVDWADAQDRTGAEIFVGMNPREREARGKAAVAVVTACYVDLDLTDGESQETALAAVTDGDAPLPSFSSARSIPRSTTRVMPSSRRVDRRLNTIGRLAQRLSRRRVGAVAELCD